MKNSSNIRKGIQLIILALVYFLAAKFSLKLAFLHVSASPVWPPTGICLAALLILGYRVWPSIWVGAFLANLATTSDVWSSAGISCGNTLEGLVGFFLIQKYARGLHFLEHPRNIFKFTLLAGIISTTISASIGVTSLALVGLADWHYYSGIWYTWWLGDVTGNLIFAPLMITWYLQSRFKWNRSFSLEFFLLLFALAGVSSFLFLGYFPSFLKNSPLEFLTIPVVVWASFRFDLPGAVTSTFLLSAAALWGTLHGHGPFIRDTPNESFLILQSFMAVISITSISLASIVLELKKVTEALKKSEEQMKAANQELSRINKLKTEFTSMVSHELRTPLNAIKEGIDLVIDGIEGPITTTQQETLEISKSNVNRLSRMIDNVLDYTRYEYGKLEVRLENTDIKQIISEVCAFMNPVVTKKSIRLFTDLPPSPLFAFCDSDKIKQVLINLIDNALKFTLSDGEIQLRLFKQENQVHIQVKNTGAVIKEEDQKKIFDLFSQGSNEVIPRMGGSGVGLAVCKLLMTLHTGTISVTSRENEGTCFTLIWPLKPLPYIPESQK